VAKETMMAPDRELDSGPPHAHQAKWQAWALVLVVLGCLATAGYAVVENFWG
jgi:hypothetical protein